ncbi:MAG: hypothetical protein IMZ53_16745, partial [Thermoplasmata archaeon]|nr:hypothetical protein [Thermoplasmata archaeon]
MKGNKIIATLVVLAMVLSTLVVLNKLNINVIGEAGAATPGRTGWGNATTELKYNIGYASDSIIINTSGGKWTNGTVYYVYYPTYKCNATVPQAYLFSWDGPYTIGGFPVTVTATTANTLLTGKDKLNTNGNAIKFNRSGMWIFDDVAAVHKGNDTSTFAGYIWVNATTNFTINSVTDINFGDSGTKEFSVETGGVGCNIAIMDPDNHTFYNEYRSTGVTLPIGVDNFTKAGDYTIKAYADLDAITGTNIYHDVVVTSDYQNYSAYYGSGGTFPASPSTHAEYYSYTNVGPWDPPEMNATDVTFTVNTGEPTITLTNTTIYWGFETRIDVNVTDSDGKGLTNNSAAKTNCTAIKLKHGSTYYDYTDVYINETGNGNYTIEIPRVPSTPWANWSNLGATAGATAGTWRVVFTNNSNDDDIDEWNGTASFVVKSASPPVQLILVNYTDKKVDVPVYVDGVYHAPIINISFDIFGTSINDAKGRAYYGDNTSWEDEKNITVEGDILYPVDSTTLRHTGIKGRWYTHVTPTKPGGTITITIDWPGDDNGTATQTIEIVNGTYVTSAVDKFTVGADYNLT